jgi:protein-tyrosine-phosphatase
MAAAILRQRIAQLGLEHQVQVLSAGVWAEAGYGASTHAITTFAARGIDLTEHRSQLVTTTLLAEADIVLVMEEAHRRSLFHLEPRQLHKVYLLTEMSARHEDVADPYGGPLTGYARTADLLEQLVDAGLPQILNLLKLER